MKLTLDPMPALRATAAVKVNGHFARLAGATMHQESAWRRKREIARDVRSGDAAGMAISEEASLRGLTIQAFADLILAKPDPAQIADTRELGRQTALLAIDAAATPAELDALLNDLSKAG